MLNTCNIDVSCGDNALKVINELGLSLSEAVNIFLEKVNDEGKLPFDLPDRDIGISDDEILLKLEEAEEDISAGKTCSFEEFKEHIRRRRNELRS